MLFWKREVSVIRQFKGLDNLSNRYWAWVELPDINLVPDGLAFQLDSWMTNGIENG